MAHDIKQVALAGKNYLYPVRRVKIAMYQKGSTVEDFFQTVISRFQSDSNVLL